MYEESKKERCLKVCECIHLVERIRNDRNENQMNIYIFIILYIQINYCPNEANTNPYLKTVKCRTVVVSITQKDISNYLKRER